MDKRILFKPRLDLVLVRRRYETVMKQSITGDVTNPIIKDVGSEEPIDFWVEVVRISDEITDLKEGQVVFWNEKGHEIEYNKEKFYLVKNENIFATDEAFTA